MQNALVLGTFDGLHIGHRAVIDAAKGYNIIAVTFKMPPKAFVSRNCGMLMTFEARADALKRLGVSEILSLDFPSVKDTYPIDFLESLFCEYAPSLICCGYNYRFGRGASGNSETLKAFCDAKNINFFCCEQVSYNGYAVSSTLIRDLIRQGKISEANELMYENFCFSAKVIDGDHRGRTIGFPTFNQIYPDNLVVPKFGVYTSKSFVDGVEYKSITNIGVRPTFRTERVMCETHIPDFSGNLYGKNIILKPEIFLRGEKKFDSVFELKEAIKNDIVHLS